ncbi:MAG: c-type cytochrome [Chloroflexota bacterium]|nr:MAG: c-type cytochrome [Chloroflexota bacterium]
MKLPENMSLPERQRVPGLPIGLIDRLRSVPRWGWFFVAMFVLPMAILPIGALANFTTSSSQFCLSCHQVGDTTDVGVKSVVHPGFDKVTCVDCHAKPGQLVFEGYLNGFMAEPERVSGNCVRCHENITQTNGTAGFKYNFLTIDITHQKHLQRGATCTLCHSDIAHDNAVPQTNRPKMQNCQACHAVTDSCNKCHASSIPATPPPPPAPASAGYLGDGRVYYLRVCSACHGPKGDNVQKANLHSQEFLDKLGDTAVAKAISEGRGVMPGYGSGRGGSLTDEQIRSILGYLKTEAVGANKPDPSAVYDRNCLTCHGQQGDKIPSVSLQSPEFWNARSVPLLYFSVDQGKEGMPAFGKDNGGRLTRAEIEGVLSYLQQQSGAAAPPVGPGADLYAQRCAACHGPTGAQVPTARMESKSFFADRQMDALVKATADGKGGMPALGKAKGGPLSDDDIKAILDYLKSKAQ